MNPSAEDLDTEIERFRAEDRRGRALRDDPGALRHRRTSTGSSTASGQPPIPILVGIWPVRSFELAFRLHNEVPGITIPEAVQKQLADAGPDAAKVGLELARELLEEARPRAAGIYVIPPFKEPAAALDLLDVSGARCAWAQGDELRAYHDEEWGRPVTDERGLYERLCLEAFQSGLSWITILRKREGFRAAFAGFDPDAVAGFGARDVERLLEGRRDRAQPREDRGGDRERQGAWWRCGRRRLRSPSSSGRSRRPRPLRRGRHGEIPAVTPSRRRWRRRSRRDGFRFVGPDDRVRADAGVRSRERPRGGLPCARPGGGRAPACAGGSVGRAVAAPHSRHESARLSARLVTDTAHFPR